MKTRETKFRAWDKKENIMVDREYWLLLDCNGELYEYSLGKLNTVSSNYEVMQFTGLCDKNGKEIYEGDIVQHILSFGEVEFVAGCFRIVKKDGNIVIFGVDINGASCEIIGNIYQNPELLN